MTKEEFESKVRDLNARMNALYKEKLDVQKAYIENYPIQPGNKCLDSNGTVCHLSRMFFLYDDCKPVFKVYYMKKDGVNIDKRERNVYGKLTKAEQ